MDCVCLDSRKEGGVKSYYFPGKESSLNEQDPHEFIHALLPSIAYCICTPMHAHGHTHDPNRKDTCNVSLLQMEGEASRHLWGTSSWVLYEKTTMHPDDSDTRCWKSIW